MKWSRFSVPLFSVRSQGLVSVPPECRPESLLPVLLPLCAAPVVEAQKFVNSACGLTS